MTTSRQLAAIMFTDMVGYTALMGSDEKSAVELLRANRNLHKRLLHQYNGKLLKEMGDGILASFLTITDAVYCAGSIQKETAQIDGLNLRIGIHQGEILLEGDDIYGDGVNIASRIEGLADAGKILVSEPVFNNIKNRTGITGQFEGEHEFKNVDRTVKVYSIQVEEFPEVIPIVKSRVNRKILFGGLIGIVFLVLLFIINPFQSSSNIETVNPLINSEIEKSIAALPFKNLSEDKSNQHFCDGVLDGILNNLSIIEDLRVISRTSIEKYRETTLQTPEIARDLNVSYLLEASVFKSGNKIRVTAQLLDANRDQHIWSDQYDRDISDVFTVMSEISKEVASEIRAVIKPEEEQRIDAIPTENMVAYEYYLKGQELQSEVYRSLFRGNWWKLRDSAHSMYNSALELDSNFALPYFGLATIYFDKGAWYTEIRNRELLDSVLVFCEMGLMIDPDEPSLYWIKGRYYEQVNEFEKARIEYERVVALNPNNIKALHSLSKVYRRKKDYVTSFQLLKKAEKIDKSKVGLAETYRMFRNFYYSIMDFEKANMYASMSIRLDVTNNDYFDQAWILLDQNKFKEARDVVIEHFDAPSGAYYHWNGMYNLYTQKFDSAVIYLKKYTDLSDENINKFGWVLYGTALVENGETGKGIELLKKWLSKLEENINLKQASDWDLMLCAGIASYTGEIETGLKYFRRVNFHGEDGNLLPWMEFDPLYKNLISQPKVVETIKQKNKEFKEIREKIFRLDALGELD